MEYGDRFIFVKSAKSKKCCSKIVLIPVEKQHTLKINKYSDFIFLLGSIYFTGQWPVIKKRPNDSWGNYVPHPEQQHVFNYRSCKCTLTPVCYLKKIETESSVAISVAMERRGIANLDNYCDVSQIHLLKKNYINILVVYHWTQRGFLVRSHVVTPTLHQCVAAVSCYRSKKPNQTVGDSSPTWTDGRLNDLIKCFELLSSSWTPK